MSLAELGAAVTGLRLGQRTLVLPTLSCGACSACAAGDDNLCREYDVLGRRRNGGYAESVTVPAVNCLPYPERLSWEQAAAVPLVWNTTSRSDGAASGVANPAANAAATVARSGRTSTRIVGS